MKTKRVFQIAQGAFLFVLVFCLTLPIHVIPASAAESQVWDESRTGSITIQKYVESDFLDSGENLSQEEIAAYLQEQGSRARTQAKNDEPARRLLARLRGEKIIRVRSYIRRAKAEATPDGQEKWEV